MPKIPTYSGGASFSGSYAPNLRVNSEQVDAALKQNVETLEGFAQRADKLEAGKARTDLMQRLGKEQEELRAGWTPDSGDDFVTKAQERYSEISDEYLSNASNKRSRDFMSSQFGDIQSAFILKDQQYTYSMQSKESARQLGDFSNEQANAAHSGMRPDKFEEAFDKTADDLQMHHDLVEVARQTAVPAVWASWFYGRIERADSAGQYKSIYNDIVGGDYDDKLTPQQKITLTNLTESRQKTAATKKIVSVRKVFEDSVNILQSAASTDVIHSREEFDRLIDSITTPENKDTVAREFHALKEQILEGVQYAGMSRQDLMAEGTRLSTEGSHLREGDLAGRSDAISRHKFKSSLVASRLLAWTKDPHGMLANQTGDDVVAVDFSSIEAIQAGVIERTATQERLREEQDIRFPDLWPQEDKAALRASWSNSDASGRMALVAGLQQAISLDTPEGRAALAEAGDAATGGSVLKFGFMVRDPRVMHTLMRGASNEPLLRGSEDWSELEDYATNTVLPLLHENNPGLKAEYRDALVTYVAGSAVIGEAGKPKLDIHKLEQEFKKATDALLGARVVLPTGHAYFPADSNGDLVNSAAAQEAILNSSDAVISAATGGLYDHREVAMPDQAFALQNANFVVRREGVLMRIDFEDGSRGFVLDEHGEPLALDINRLIAEYEKTPGTWTQHMQHLSPAGGPGSVVVP